MRRIVVLAPILLMVLQAAPAHASAPLYPDLRTVVPTHLGIQNEHQREMLRFSNGIANTGAGAWRMRPEFPGADPTQPQSAIQEILDGSGNVALSKTVSRFEFHPAHNHWHIAAVARFDVRHATDDGTGGAFGAVAQNASGAAQSLKVTFCLIDWYALDGNSSSKKRTYFECNSAYQGVSAGWVDQYHQSTEGQELDLTGAPAGVYYLVSTANPDGVFLESDTTNNTAWTSFALARDSKGNPKVRTIARSACSLPALCGEKIPNR